MNLRKIIPGLCLLAIPSFTSCKDKIKVEKRQVYEREIAKETSAYITGRVVDEIRSQDFYVIKIQTPEGKIYAVDIRDGIRGVTKESIDILCDKDEKTTISFPASNRVLLRHLGCIKSAETNFYNNPDQYAGSKFSSRIKILP